MSKYISRCREEDYGVYKYNKAIDNLSKEGDEVYLELYEYGIDEDYIALYINGKRLLIIKVYDTFICNENSISEEDNPYLQAREIEEGYILDFGCPFGDRLLLKEYMEKVDDSVLSSIKRNYVNQQNKYCKYKYNGVIEGADSSEGIFVKLLPSDVGLDIIRVSVGDVTLFEGIIGTDVAKEVSDAFVVVFNKTELIRVERGSRLIYKKYLEAVDV